MTSLDALRARGWSVDEYDDEPTDPPTTEIDVTKAPGHEFSCLHEDRDTAVRMALAAALVAEGHDLIGLIRECREELLAWQEAWVDQGFSRDDSTDHKVARIDAVLAAVDGAT